MKTAGVQPIWDAWYQGEFVGENKPAGRVTVEDMWGLNVDGEGNRSYQNSANSQDETEIPGIKTININRSIDTDAATCRISMYNTILPDGGPTGADVTTQGMEVLGEPGFFTPWRGDVSNDRWGLVGSGWNDVLGPNALLRTYQGYGGHDMSLSGALGAGYITLSGVWLVDEVTVGTNGIMILSCRDMAKLLIDQQLYPPLIPEDQYPLKYCNYHQQDVIPREVTKTVEGTAEGSGEPTNVPLVYSFSTTDNWYGTNASLYGHRGTDSNDGNPDTFALGVGNGQPNAPYVAEFWEYQCGAQVSEVYVQPWGGPYQMFISINENGVWIDDSGQGNIYHDLSGIPGAPPSYAAIPFVMQTSAGSDSGTWYKLPRTYDAAAIRVTFQNLMYTQWGPNHYRAGVREIAARNVPSITVPTTSTVTETINEVVTKHIYNYEDYADIIVDLCQWSGFYLEGGGGVYGNIETTGAFAPETCLPESMFDKRPVMDAITELKNITGYLFYIDDEGAVRFETPNWWSDGNSSPEGRRIGTIPNIDENRNLTDYSASHTDAPVRSKIVISSHLPESSAPGTLTTTAVPDNADVLRGMVKPAMWVNDNFTVREEQEAMAVLIGMHTWFRQRKGHSTVVGNPCIQIDDQVRITERQTADTFIHYVRGIQSNMDLDSGDYSMTLETHWMGDESNWTIEVTVQETPTVEEPALDPVNEPTEEGNFGVYVKDTGHRTVDGEWVDTTPGYGILNTGEYYVLNPDGSRTIYQELPPGY